MEPNQTPEHIDEQPPFKTAAFRLRRGKCIVCSNQKNVEVTEKYLNEEISLRDAGKELGCHYLTFNKHIHQHVLPILEKDPMIAPDLRLRVDKIRILEDIINKLYVRAQLLLDQEDINQGEIKAITSELNNFLQTLARLTKELGSDVNINLGSPESELFRKVAEEILVKEHADVWIKIRKRMIEMASSGRTTLA